MRGMIVGAVALFAAMTFAPSSQASPLIPAGGVYNTLALQGMATEARWYRYRWHRWHRRCWRWRWC